jgi:hypothetical protein
MATLERFALDAYAEEIRRAPENLEVGTKLLSENDEIRVWTAFRFDTFELLRT